jgi:pimeloyl-ACP methyl ester carboxylesterase
MAKTPATDQTTGILLALHGNPGTGTDFDLLRTHLQLPPHIRFVAWNRPVPGVSIDTLLQELQQFVSAQKEQEVHLLTYSAGGYLAAQALQHQSLRVRSLIMINPALAPGKPLPFLAKQLFALPWIGEHAVDALQGKLKAELITRTFSPLSPPVQGLQYLEKTLNGKAIWLAALHYKAEQENHPINPQQPLTVPHVLLLRSDVDESIHWPAHRTVFERLIQAAPHTEEILISQGAHGLIWTHPAELAGHINRWLAELSVPE